MDEFRKAILAKRANLSTHEITAYSKQIQTSILPFIKEGMVIGCYYEMGDEVQLQSLIQQLFHRCKIAFPVCERHGIMHFYQVDEHTRFQKSAYGIQEPVESDRVSPQSFDIMLIPMVAFDDKLHRIGHGAGYYDRYLAQTNALKIGIAFSIQKVDKLEKTPHDIDMDVIITETTIYQK